jgi:micrococcal nuclease
MVNETSMSVALVLLALTVAVASPAAAGCSAGSLTGTVTYVRDGDTIELEAMAIRFEGIAAPEWNAPGGPEATEAVKALVLGEEVRCELTGKATYDRCVAVCYLNGADVEATIVRTGLARDCPRYSGGRHGQAELNAVAEGATIRTTYQLPDYCRER